MAAKNTPTTQADIVVSTSITVGGPHVQHADVIVVSTPITAGSFRLNHVEGIVVSTAITAGPGSGAGGVWLNHAEGIVGPVPVPAGIVVRTGIVGGPKRIFIGSLS